METAIRNTFTIYNTKENRLIRTFNFLNEAEDYIKRNNLSDVKIEDTHFIMNYLSSK